MRDGKSGRATARGRHGFLLPTLALLSACGGGDGGSPSPPPAPPTNRAPTFTSAATASIAENSSGAVYQAAASDPDGDTLTYSISGGADAARFSITSAGQLAFVAAPNFDLAADADDDNVYQVQISASDGRATANLSLSVTVTNSKEGIAVRRIATGFTDPVAISPFDDTTILVAERAGSIYSLNPQTGARTLLTRVANVGGVGVLAITALNTYGADGSFFVMYTTTNGFLVINWYVRNPAGPTVPNNFGPVLEVSAPDYAGGGWLGYDGTSIVAATGDAGGLGDPAGSAQNDASWLGKLIRFTRNPDPFAGVSPVYFLRSIVAKGLHQPNGGGQVLTGLVIADRGQGTAEELNVFPGGNGPTNYGWPFNEGSRTVRGTAPANAINPIVEYPRGPGSRTGQAIVGGALAPDSLIPLRNLYVFADRSGAIFTTSTVSLLSSTAVPARSLERRDADFVPDQGAIESPVAIVNYGGRILYILDADGELFRVDAG